MLYSGEGRFVMRLTICHSLSSIVLGMIFSLHFEPCVRAQQPAGCVRGAEFRVAWNNGVTVHLDQKSLRLALEQLCTSRRIAWVIDRRLDPEQSVSCPSTSAPLSEFLPQLLKTIGADAVVVGSTVIVGPQEPIRELRTLGEIQRVELQKCGLPAPRKQALGRPTELHWEELAEPRELVAQLTQRALVDLAGTELIPYDLWGRGSLSGMTPGEAVTVVAWQYDLQLKWEASGHATLVPLQLPVTVSRGFPIPGVKRDAAQLQFPALAWKDLGKTMQATGRVEELEALDQWIKGSTKPKPKPKTPGRDWRNRTFTLRMANTPLLTALESLKEQGIPLDWEAEALTAAGVDLKTELQIELNEASAEELLSALCAPAKLKYEITALGAKILPP